MFTRATQSDCQTVRHYKKNMQGRQTQKNSLKRTDCEQQFCIRRCSIHQDLVL